MFDHLIDFLENLDNTQLDDGQREAAVQLLAIVMFADGYDSQAEQRYLDRIGERSGMDAGRLHTICKDIGTAVRDRHLRGHDLQELLDEVLDRLGSGPAVKQLYLLCDRMANRDQQVTEGEQAILDHLVARSRAD